MTKRTAFQAAVEQLESGVACVAVEGEIDIASADRLRDALAEANDSGGTLVDLTECGFIDSTGLGVLLSAARELEERGGSLVVACRHKEVQELLSLTAIDRSVPTYESREEALRHLAGASSGSQD